MQEIIIIAGPNGAGKTSFANEYLSSFRGRFVFLNADEVARETASPGMPQAQLDIRAGREMLTRIDDCIDAGLNVAFETLGVVELRQEDTVLAAGRLLRRAGVPSPGER